MGSHSLCTVGNSVLFLQDGPTPWAAADLGDNERKQKFLRLMGAGKVCLVIFYVDYFSQPSHQGPLDVSHICGPYWNT